MEEKKTGTSYMTLYNRIRPRWLDGLIGQEHIAKAVMRLLQNGETPNLVFAGIRGSGKTTLARIIAMSLSCKHPHEDGSPCLECENCRSIMETGHSLNVTEMDGGKNRKIDDIRALIEKTKLAPVGAKINIFIIDEVHMLTNEAFNALLKIIEETPPWCMFILCTTEKDKIPQTILSRCQVFDFKPISSDNIFSYLKKVCEEEGIEYEDNGLRLICTHARNSMRDALSALEQCSYEKITEKSVAETLGYPDEKRIFALADAVRKGDVADISEICSAFESNGLSPLRVMDHLLKSLYDTEKLLLTGETPGYEGYTERCVAFADKCGDDEEFIYDFIMKLGKVRKDLNSDSASYMLLISGLVGISEKAKKRESLEDTVKKLVEQYMQGMGVNAPVYVPPIEEPIEEPEVEKQAEEPIPETTKDNNNDGFEDAAEPTPFDESDDSDEGEEGAVSIADFLGEDDADGCFPSDSGVGNGSAGQLCRGDGETESKREEETGYPDLDSLDGLF